MKRIFVSVLIILLFVSLRMTFSCKADIVWSDNFDDGNYGGWTVRGGNFTVEDGMLKAGSESSNTINCESFIPYGTWSFDLLPTLTAKVIFVSIDSDLENDFQICTGAHDSTLNLARYVNGSRKYIYSFAVSISAWQHLDVTRNLDGRICVYDNGTLFVDMTDTTAISASHYYFEFWSQSGAIIDNIVVSDTVNIQPPAEPFYMQSWFIPSIVAITLVVIIAVILLIRRK